jgi:hypothetical protein
MRYLGKLRAALRRSHRETDDLLVLQLAHQGGDFILCHRLVAELQPKQAALGTVDDRGLLTVEQCRDIGDARVGRKPHQRAWRRFRPQGAGDGFIRA